MDSYFQQIKFIIVHQIFEFKSSHLSIISDIDKINNLLNFILIDFKFILKNHDDILDLII